MSFEIERKFLVNGGKESLGQLSGYESRTIAQGYISVDKDAVVRVRISDDRGFITIKGKAHGATRREVEFEAPIEKANELLNSLCKFGVVVKTRYLIPYKDHTWEVDIFDGDNRGLIVAEIELDSEDQQFEKPPWAGKEVTLDHAYSNSNLAQKPYCLWEDI